MVTQVVGESVVCVCTVPRFSPVCLQKRTKMNGAELGEGVVLHVEPAENSSNDDSYYGNAVATVATAATLADNDGAATREPNKGEEDDPELDDFFDSL